MSSLICTDSCELSCDDVVEASIRRSFRRSSKRGTTVAQGTIIYPAGRSGSPNLFGRFATWASQYSQLPMVISSGKAGPLKGFANFFMFLGEVCEHYYKV